MSHLEGHQDVLRRGEILSWISAAFCVVCVLVPGFVFWGDIGDVDANYALSAAGVALYAATFLLARKGRVDLGGLMAALGVTFLVWCTAFTVRPESPFLFMGTMMPLLVSIVSRRAYVPVVVGLNLTGLVVLWLLADPPDNAFYAALALTHLCTGAVGLLYATSQTSAYQQAVRATQEAERASRAKSAFLASMSHELRTPLTTIIGYVELVREEIEGRVDDHTLQDLDLVKASSKQLLTLINDLLDLSKVEAGKFQFLIEPVCIDSLVSEVVEQALPLVHARSNTVHVEGRAGTIHGDRQKTRQILLNLLSNAAKFTADSPITLRLARTDDVIAIDVIDQGVGIAGEAQQRVFETFSQASNTTSRDHGGTGLGLPLARGFARGLGGDLTLTSEVGVGSTFTVVLAIESQTLQTPGHA